METVSREQKREREKKAIQEKMEKQKQAQIGVEVKTIHEFARMGNLLQEQEN